MVVLASTKSCDLVRPDGQESLATQFISKPQNATFDGGHCDACFQTCALKPLEQHSISHRRCHGGNELLFAPKSVQAKKVTGAMTMAYDFRSLSAPYRDEVALSQETRKS